MPKNRGEEEETVPVENVSQRTIGVVSKNLKSKASRNEKTNSKKDKEKSKKDKDKSKKDKKKSKKDKDQPSDFGSKRKKTKKILEKEAEKQGFKKKHRFHPGTVALRKIKNRQQNPGLILQVLPTRRIFREVASYFGDEKIQFTKNAFESAQHILEHLGTQWTKEATDLSAGPCKKKTLQGYQLKYVWSKKFPHIPTSLTFEE